ncbi:MAG: hypothetical protein Kow0029_04230 [Candidatus Rifleibacteriota bacterium]
MKKFYFILLGLFIVISGSSFAADINNVSSEKWLDHVSQMQVMRQQILNLLSRPTPTIKDKEMLSALQKSFEEKKADWDNYLKDVADGKTQMKQEKICTNCGSVCQQQNACATCCQETCGAMKKACRATSEIKCKHEKKSEYHRYNKKPRRNFKKEYHRYHKRCRSGYNRDTSTQEEKSCGKECLELKKAMKRSCKTCPEMKQAKACNEGVDCKSCPSHKTESCCKVSGKCAHGNKHQHKVKETKKMSGCPVCNEYKLMGLKIKCAKCSKK